MTAESRLYRFGPFEFDARSGDLCQGGETTRLPQQPAALLTALLDRDGQVLTRGDITALLWPDGVHVDSEAGINFVVRQLRRSLGDDASAPRVIETLPRRGYRLLVPVDRALAPLQHTLGPAPRRRYQFALGGFLAAGLAILAILIARPSASPPRLLVQFGTDPAGSRHFDRDGMRDMTIAALNRPARTFEIVAPAMADTYLNRPFPQAREELSLDLLLHVSIRDAGGHPQLHAKLVRALDGMLIWTLNRDYAIDALHHGGRGVADQIAAEVRTAIEGDW